ncbi:SAM-dependent methyltransferase [Rufibacter immobilis]|uniref:SAM-dependent methyltransferase n=1 Tax=Rufibacter immobilis TaxID=1348778 RepID=A0A3M9MX52_9BACT|nr:tRNA (5-methylaminomethyl-2-thiouridine)(34)-methyltransferase MnmD [Rufibacter immobilis]RNI30106.1 SAM-dependent methyltransferase [Rufibacter immobilis]
MNVEVKQTKDGSTTLFVPALNEHYHSVHGALQESLHVFIKMGLQAALETRTGVRVLEVGFGTGLNALLTLQHTLASGATVHYTTLEKYPLTPQVVAQLQFDKFILNPELLDFFGPLHAAAWEQPVPVTPQFTLLKLETDLEAFAPSPNSYDLIYFDAFAPEKQPHLWTDAIFQKMHDCLSPGGTLVTYCAKGSFKRSLKAAGFAVEALPGPPGKREMTRGVKA